MPKMYLAIIVLALAVALAGCDWADFEHGGSMRYREDFHYTHPLKAGGKLYLESFNGSVEITGWEKDEVEINGTRYANTPENLNALKVDVVTAADSVRIRSLRPSERRGGMGVRYVIRAPRKVELDSIISSNGAIRIEGIEGNGRLRTSNGSIRALRYLGNLEANTSNGSVEVQEFRGAATVRTSNGSIKADGVRGFFEAVTSNGGVDARVVEADPGRPLRVHTSNGHVTLTIENYRGNDIRAETSNSSITLRLPSSAGARLRASTSNSSIASDFVATREERKTKTFLECTIGSGGGLVDLNTSNGPIRILKQ